MVSRVNRRGFLRRTAAAGTAVGLPIASITADHVEATELRPAGVDLRWLGVNGWEISFDGKRVLIDPWLTRFPAIGPDGAFDRSTPLTVDHALVDEHVTGVDVVLVTHGHFDHIADVPYVMSKFPDARVVGTETHAHLLAAMGVDERQVIWARGGELFDFDGFTVEVIPSLHSLDEDHRYLFSGTANAQPEPPRTIGDLIEGGTLAYQVTIGERLRVLNTGTANLIERALTGLHPDVAILSYTRSPGTHRYLDGRWNCWTGRGSCCRRTTTTWRRRWPRGPQWTRTCWVTSPPPWPRSAPKARYCARNTCGPSRSDQQVTWCRRS
jgi:L-ascorbate metabolism protein UlaG (beta-lactamase superfamily)